MLVHLPLPSDNSELPKPHRANPDAWDNVNVRLPNHSQSKFVEIDETGNKHLRSRWNLIEESLLQPIQTSHDLEKAIKKYNTRYADIWKFETLHELLQVHFINDDSTFFFNDLLPKIINIALRLPHLIQCPIPLLKQGMNKSISMSQEQCACLLANGFLCTFPRRNTDKKGSEYSSYPEINFNRLYQSRGQNVIEKLKCILNYFRVVLCDSMPTGMLTFQRRSIGFMPKWESCDKKFSSIKLHVSSSGKIEDADAMIQIDFANKFVGGGVLGHGCVQEEIRFVLNPEMIVAKLFTECLRDDEALVMIGCEKYNSYVGYASTFQWVNSPKDSTPSDNSRRRKGHVVAIDALQYNNYAEQFRETNILRELNKAFVGFYNENFGREPIASGFWGCGAFNGHPLKSALIQLMASCKCQRNLVFFTFNDERLRDQILEIYEFFIEKGMTVGQLFIMLQKFKYDINSNDTEQIFHFIRRENENLKLLKPKLYLKQEPLFNFVLPKASTSVENNSDDKIWTWNRKQSTSSMKAKFADFDAKFDVQKAKQKKSLAVLKKIEEPKKPSLIESLDMDMKVSSSSSSRLKSNSKPDFFDSDNK